MAVLSTLALGACSVFGVRDGTEEPKYAFVAKLSQVEIREYSPRIAAETTVAGDEISARSEGFRKLAGYIFGANTGNAKVAMTAPVAQSSQTIAMTAPVSQDRDPSGRWVVRFFMPAKYTLDTLPVPSDSQVRLVGVPAQTMAVLRFSGSTGSAAVASRQAELLAALQATEWRPTGFPMSWFYDPPWTIPALRRNEVAVPVAR